MAYLDEEDDILDPNATSAVSTSTESSYVNSAGGGSAAPNEGQPSAANTPDNPGNFVGIQQYLAQNKPQASKLGENVGGFVEKKGEQATAALDGAVGQFNQQIESKTVAPNQELFNAVKADPTSLVKDEEKKNQFATMRDATWSGPNTIEEVDYFQPVMQAVTGAKKAAESTKTVEGRNSLLGGLRDQSTQRGARVAGNLDNALLGASPDSNKFLAKARDSVGGIDQKLSKAQTDANASALAAKKSTEDARTMARGVLNEGWSGLGASLSEREAQQEAEAKAFVDSLVGSVRSGQLTPEQLQVLGVDPARNIYNVDVGSHIGYRDNVDAQSVATSDDIAKQEALRMLAGDAVDLGANFLDSSRPIGQTGRAGLVFDPSKVQGEINAQEAAYTREAAPIDAAVAQYRAGKPPMVSEEVWHEWGRKQLEAQAALRARYNIGRTLTSSGPGVLTSPKFTPIS